MKHNVHWQKYSVKVAWPTIFMFFGLFLVYVMLWFAFKSGFTGLWTSLIGAILAYGMFTIAHEACHGNISGGTASFMTIKR